MMYRGLDPTTIPLKYALAYYQNREDYFEMSKRVWKEAASEVFGDG